MFYVCGKKDGKYGVKDTNDGVVEYYTRAQIQKICGSGDVKIIGVRQDYTKQTIRIVPIQFNYSSVNGLSEHLQRYLKDKGIRNVDRHEAFHDKLYSVGFRVRFLGGYDAWSGDDEDMCDADILDEKVIKLVEKACREFEKSTGVSVSFYTTEKAWSNFEFH